jgi:glycosyl transferase family 25
MKRFVINLKRRPDRLEQFFKRCPYPMESFEIIEAFDGKFPEQESKKERKLLSKFYDRIQTGARGCAISHLRIWKKMVNENIPVAMIFEDDALFNENFLSFMDTLILPEKFNVIYFGGRFQPNFTVPPEHMKLVNEKVYQHIHENQWNMRIHERTTHGYIITSKLARFLIHLFEISEKNEEVDHHMIHTFRGLNLPYHSTLPLVCWSPMVGDSDIR